MRTLVILALVVSVMASSKGSRGPPPLSLTASHAAIQRGEFVNAIELVVPLLHDPAGDYYAEALLTAGSCWGNLNNDTEALFLLDLAVGAFAARESPAEQLVAMEMKASILLRADRYQDALKTVVALEGIAATINDKTMQCGMASIHRLHSEILLGIAGDRGLTPQEKETVLTDADLILGGVLQESIAGQCPQDWFHDALVHNTLARVRELRNDLPGAIDSLRTAIALVSVDELDLTSAVHVQPVNLVVTASFELARLLRTKQINLTEQRSLLHTAANLLEKMPDAAPRANPNLLESIKAQLSQIDNSKEL